MVHFGIGSLWEITAPLYKCTDPVCGRDPDQTENKIKVVHHRTDTTTVTYRDMGHRIGRIIYERLRNPRSKLGLSAVTLVFEHLMYETVDSIMLIAMLFWARKYLGNVQLRVPMMARAIDARPQREFTVVETESNLLSIISALNQGKIRLNFDVTKTQYEYLELLCETIDAKISNTPLKITDEAILMYMYQYSVQPSLIWNAPDILSIKMPKFKSEILLSFGEHQYPYAVLSTCIEMDLEFDFNTNDFSVESRYLDYLCSKYNIHKCEYNMDKFRAALIFKNFDRYQKGRLIQGTESYGEFVDTHAISSEIIIIKRRVINLTKGPLYEPVIWFDRVHSIE